MKNLTLMLGVVATISFTSCQQKEQAPDDIKHVVVIGIDGFSASGLRKANPVFMDSLMSVGAYSLSVRTVLPTVSSPNWASLIMGAGPAQHGITSNDWELDAFQVEPVVSDTNFRFPSIFTIFREQRPTDEVGAIYNWSGFGRLFDSNDVNLSKTYPTQDDTVQAFANYIVDKKPVFSWVHFDEVDHAGHDQGHGTPEYFEAIRKADSCVRVVYDAIKKAGMEKNTLLMIVADHGGIGSGHGGEDIEELTVPMIFYGAGVKKGHQIQHQVYQYDASATIAFALNLKQPYEWIGRPVKAAFEGFDEPVVNWKGVKRQDAPTIYPRSFTYAPTGALLIDTVGVVSMADADEQESQNIYYTTDGTDPDASSKKYTGPFTVDQTAVVKARIIENGAAGKIASAYFRVLKSGQGNGVRYKLYQGKGWKDVPNFAALQPVAEFTGHEFQVDDSKLTAAQKDGSEQFGLVAESLLDITVEGEYQFFTRSDDGSKLYIDGKLVVDNGGDHGVQERNGKTQLTKGKHAIRIEHFNGSQGYWLDAFYSGPGLTKQIIPADRLYLK
ncbi:alkaline phosphatase family protein [Flavihumibacter sp. RY-1]|uniref:Alkaline phosphatase family protein n=1 Tax=Flavihumibacter fluminis TaxID=2909236 RepID=A0ABS9BF55_9BACT|nr:alkaline phosphatase family protein [Flavihumibacter fluminis]MCF1713291.1 alkaline phosphatase family protein [Flavihumibacter fluminis]